MWIRHRVGFGVSLDGLTPRRFDELQAEVAAHLKISDGAAEREDTSTRIWYPTVEEHKIRFWEWAMYFYASFGDGA
jgi:hypothetical protein